MASTRLSSDICAYAAKHKSIQNQEKWTFDSTINENKNKSFHNLGIIGLTQTNHIVGDRIDIENELKGYNKATRCLKPFDKSKSLPQNGTKFCQMLDYSNMKQFVVDTLLPKS